MVCCVAPAVGQPPYCTPPWGVNPNPLALLQQSYQNVCYQIIVLSATPKLNYSVDGVAANWDEHMRQLLDEEEHLRKIPGVAPTIEGPFQIIQQTGVSRGWGIGWGGYYAGCY